MMGLPHEGVVEPVATSFGMGADHATAWGLPHALVDGRAATGAQRAATGLRLGCDACGLDGLVGAELPCF